MLQSAPKRGRKMFVKNSWPAMGMGDSVAQMSCRWEVPPGSQQSQGQRAPARQTVAGHGQVPSAHPCSHLQQAVDPLALLIRDVLLASCACTKDGGRAHKVRPGAPAGGYRCQPLLHRRHTLTARITHHKPPRAGGAAPAACRWPPHRAELVASPHVQCRAAPASACQVAVAWWHGAAGAALPRTSRRG